jgi:hypothetical protein
LAKRCKDKSAAVGPPKKKRSLKRFGKSIGSRAPGMLVQIIKRKAPICCAKVTEIEPAAIKASQYNHLENNCIKAELSQRWKLIGGFAVQRDIYSAYLLMNISDDFLAINRGRMKIKLTTLPSTDSPDTGRPCLAKWSFINSSFLNAYSNLTIFLKCMMHR